MKILVKQLTSIHDGILKLFASNIYIYSQYALRWWTSTSETVLFLRYVKKIWASSEVIERIF